jgi:hypothetical protein
MKIQTVIKEERAIEKEIELPYFCKHRGYYYKVASEEVTVDVRITEGDRPLYFIGMVDTYLRKSEISLAEECSEEEFNEVANKALFDIKQHIEPHVGLQLLHPSESTK